MRKEPSEKVSQKKITFDVRELEPLLSPPPMNEKLKIPKEVVV